MGTRRGGAGEGSGTRRPLCVRPGHVRPPSATAAGAVGGSTAERLWERLGSRSVLRVGSPSEQCVALPGAAASAMARDACLCPHDIKTMTKCPKPGPLEQ